MLRHEPGAIGITVDCNGWVEIDHLVGGRVRASQGHSVEVDLGYS